MKEILNFLFQPTKEQIILLLTQKELESQLQMDGKFVDTSVSDTIYNLIVVGHIKKAQKIKSDFKVPDRRYWWLVIKALAQIRDWGNLEKFSKDKSPIGYAPFAQVCIECNAFKEAEKYIPRVKDAAERVEFYIQIGYFEEAVETAKQAKNDQLLQYIRSKCNKPEIIHIIDQLLSAKQ